MIASSEMVNMNWDLPKQKFLNSDGKIGDCWRCCIAAILQVPAEVVPHFVQEFGSSYEAEAQRWLNSQGFYLLQSDRDIWFPRFASSDFRGLPIIESGYTVRSKRPGATHAVVTIDRKMVYDPHPSNDGLLCTTRFEMVLPMDYLTGLGNKLLTHRISC